MLVLLERRVVSHENTGRARCLGMMCRYHVTSTLPSHCGVAIFSPNEVNMQALVSLPLFSRLELQLTGDHPLSFFLILRFMTS